MPVALAGRPPRRTRSRAEQRARRLPSKVRMMRKALLVGAAIAVATPSFANAASPAPAAVCTPVRWSGNGHLYVAISRRSGLSWVEAMLRARQRGCGWYLCHHHLAGGEPVRLRPDRGQAAVLRRGQLRPLDRRLPDRLEGRARRPLALGHGRAVQLHRLGRGQARQRLRGRPPARAGHPAGPGRGLLALLRRSGGWNDLNVNAQPHGYILEFDQEHKRSCTP